MKPISPAHHTKHEQLTYAVIDSQYIDILKSRQILILEKLFHRLVPVIRLSLELLTVLHSAN